MDYKMGGVELMLCILIGYIFIFFNFNIGAFNLLPDFLGYLLIVIGLSALPHKLPAFSKARIISAVLMVLCFFRGIPFINIFFLLLFYLTYLIIYGIGEIERTEECDLGSKNLLFWFKFLVVLQIATYLFSSLISFFFPSLEALMLFFMVLNPVMFVVFLVGLNDTRIRYRSLTDSSQ